MLIIQTNRLMTSPLLVFFTNFFCNGTFGAFSNFQATAKTNLVSLSPQNTYQSPENLSLRFLISNITVKRGDFVPGEK